MPAARSACAIHENSAAHGPRPSRAPVWQLRCGEGVIRRRCRRPRHRCLPVAGAPASTGRIVPVYDYVLATEPLDRRPAGRRSDGRNRQGVSDTTNQFHYYRLTADDRILWGGYDAVFHNGRAHRPVARSARRDPRHACRALLRDLPAARRPAASRHRWGGVIDTSTRFSVTFGTAYDGRVAYAVGYTGLGVGASALRCPGVPRPAAASRLGAGRAWTWCAVGRSRSRPSRSALPASSSPGRAIAKADANQGRRGPWLRLLDRLGLGFDS